MINSKYKIINVFIAVFLLNTIACSQNNQIKPYALSKGYTPVLNSPEFSSVFGGKTGTDVKLDKEGLIAEMEFIAFPNTVFDINGTEVRNEILYYEVTTNDYQYNSAKLYIDSRFVKTYSKRPEERKKILPEKDEIVINLKSFLGYPYMWGGNYADGISKMLEYYPPKANVSENIKDLWILKGLDCSGLLYQATDGYTIRNTSSLTSIGSAVEIKDKSATEISELVIPLDLIVWNGHVVIVLDKETVIESTPAYGVHTTNLIVRLNKIMNERKPENDWNSSSGKRFVIRRWYN
jgi:hypothetical protein